MSNTFIQEAFKQFYLTEDAEEFSLNVSGPDDVESFLDIVAPEEDEEVISDVYDLEAEAKEDLKQSYLGKVILDCNVCHSNVFFNKDEITEDEDGLCCVDIECPYCMSNEGYTIIGEVKPYQEEEDVDIEDIETEEVPEEPVDDVEIDVDETEEEPEVEEDELEESIEDVYAKATKLVKGKKVSVDGRKGEIVDVLGVNNVDEDDPKAVSTEDIDEVEVTFEDGETKRVDVEDLDSPLTEGLKADEVKELRGDEEINGADGPIAAVDELEGSDEIRGPKYKELNEEVEEEEVLEEGWMPINKVSRYFQVADEYQVNDKLEARNAKTGKMLQWGTNNGGYNDDRISVKTKNGKYTSVAKETLKSEIDNLKGENLGKSPFTIDECGVPEKLDECGGGDAELVEGIEDVSISTEDENITMTTKEDGGVVVETSPKEDAVVEDEVIDGEEMIAPLEPETEADIDAAVDMNGEEDEEVLDDEELLDDDEFADFEEFDEESFDNLGESYLKRCYENVTSFKTSNITLNENKEFIIEGKIGFDSGNEKNTQFVFSKKSDENGKLKLEGYNKQISTGKKTFKLNCSINNKALVCESLNYNYKGKNELNESVRVYGTVKRK